MIKSLSPYYLNIPFVSPLTGATCSKYTLNIYVWNGLKSAVPTTPLYSVTKNNPTTSTGTDKINISRLVNDYINFIPAVGTATGLVNANNQRWCKTSVVYTTENALDFEVEQLITTNLVLKGYNYGMEGENAQPPSNRILLSGTEFKVDRNGVFNLPILINQPTSTINAVDETINIFFQDTILNVLDNDNLGFAPTSIIGITSTIPSSVGVVTIEGSTIKFTKGAGTIVTPQTFTYTIQDSLLNQDTATVTLNITAVPVLPVAVDETYSLNNVDTIDLFPMLNDALGTTPTTITAINTTGLTTGAVTIEGAGTKLTFVPNGVFGVEETLTYTITDSLANSDTGIITLLVDEVPEFTTEYFTAITGTGTITYVNDDDIVVVANITRLECVAITYKEIISIYNLENCTP